MIRKAFFTALIIIVALNFSSAQFQNPVKWSFSQKKISATDYELQYKASIEKGWHLYSDKLPEGGPIATSFKYDTISGFELLGELKSNRKPVKVLDKTFNMEVEYFGNEVTFIQQVKITGNTLVTISGVVEYMSCNDETCTPPAETEFSFSLKPSVTAEEIVVEPKSNIGELPAKEVISEEDTPEVVTAKIPGTNTTKKQGLWVFLLIAFVAGLAAILTPCVFPMIPMTVSFFMRGGDNRKSAIKTAFAFGISIVLIYTLLGALFSFGVFGPNVGSILSTHWLPNTLFFILFFIFALSFFGLFEIVLPSSLVNKTDSKVDQGGYVGAFFMALTTVIVSFSCTGPFIGYLIIEAVQGGGLRPLLGMFSFGVAFATPFTLLAVFPSALKNLPKSGGWLNSVKVVFAFILLAFGLKFLSNIDQVYGFNLLSRDLYLSIWIVIFWMLGMYLLGKIKFSHDSDLKHVGIGRFLLALASWVLTLYLFTGLLGAPLKPISSLIPPPSEKISISQSVEKTVTSENTVPLCGPAKYADKLHLPYGLSGYFDLEQGLACAKEQNKPVFLVFKGHACANCKKMENTVWDQPEVLNMLKNNYVVVALYTDDRTTLPEPEWKTSSYDGKQLKTMGRVNLDILMTKYQKNSIPYHVIIEPDGTEMEMDVTYDNDEFVGFLKKGI
jgi:thiol:disulfide interchange protein DsbD